MTTKKEKIYKLKYDYSKIQEDINAGLGYAQVRAKYGISFAALHKSAKKGRIRFMTHSEKARWKTARGLNHSPKMTPEYKKKISDSMKKGHAEGRAHNIGSSRWNNEESYPEKFFKKVISNHFEDQDYRYELPCGIYSLDFAWEHKKKVIEIDGDQHQRFEEYIARDKRKDAYLKSTGWDLLRIPWKEFYHNTKEYIQIAKDFIDGSI